MALLGLPNGSTNNDFLASIRYDAKAGRWHKADRSQNAAGEWVTDLIELTTGTVMAMDFENIEVGYIAFGSNGPDFHMVPNGQAVPPKPSDAHKPGFRIKLVLPGETEARQFASTAKSVIGVIDDLHTKAAAERGQAAVVKIAGTRVVETKGPQGTTRNYAPLLEIVKFVPRPAALGGSAPAPAPEPKPEPKAVTEKVLEDAVTF